jgi:hypothetical protein
MKLSSLSLRQRLFRWSLILVFVIASTALVPQPAQAAVRRLLKFRLTKLFNIEVHDVKSIYK